MIVSPSALTAAIASIGYSSIIEAALNLGTVMPFNLLVSAEISAINSPFISLELVNLMFAPISISVLNKPVLKSLTHTFITLTLLFGVINAETIGNEALEGSEGTFMSNGLSVGIPSSVIFHFEFFNLIVSILAPKYFNILSV